MLRGGLFRSRVSVVFSCHVHTAGVPTGIIYRDQILQHHVILHLNVNGGMFHHDNDRGARCSSVVRAFAHGAIGRRIDPSWGVTKGRGMCYPVCGMVHIKEPLLLIGKSSPCSGSGFPLSLSEWSFTICPTPYNRKNKIKRC